MEDKLVKCNHCGSDMCYSTQINETSWAYNCVNCGFGSSDLIKEGEYDVEEYESTLPELYKDLKYIDSQYKVWYPLVMQTEEGLVFIDGTNTDTWGWGAIKNRALTSEEQQVYIKENKEVPPYKSDSSTLKHFGKLGFLQALNYINGI